MAVIAAATGLRGLLAIAVVWLTGRLRPVLARAAEVTMVEAALGAELAATNKPGCNDAFDIADRGAQVTPDLVEEAQDVLAAAATLTAGAAVLAVLHPLLLPLLLLACLPQAAAYIRSARVTYLAKVATAPSARAGRGRTASAVPAPTPGQGGGGHRRTALGHASACQCHEESPACGATVRGRVRGGPAPSAGGPVRSSSARCPARRHGSAPGGRRAHASRPV